MNLYYLGEKSSWKRHSKNIKTVASRKYINAFSISKKRKKINKKTGKSVVFQPPHNIFSEKSRLEKKL